MSIVVVLLSAPLPSHWDGGDLGVKCSQNNQRDTVVYGDKEQVKYNNNNDNSNRIYFSIILLAEPLTNEGG